MKNIKFIIATIMILLVGAAIGWLAKPTAAGHPAATHGHDGAHDAADTAASATKEEVWTCSMHPQVRQNEFGICPICEMDLITLDTDMSNDDPTILKMTNAAAKLAQIETTIVGGSSKAGAGEALTNQNIQVDGTVELDERSVNSQASHVSGRIESLLVNFEGDYVKAGQKIATIYSTELLAASQELITAAKFDDRVQGLKDASIQKLKNWKISDTQIQQILDSGIAMETIDIYADHSGYVLQKKVSQGDYLKQGQALYTVGRTGRLWLIFNVFESDLANIRKGQSISFTTPSVPGKAFNTKVSYIDPLLNSASRTASVRAEINNSGNKLKPGMLIEGEIIAISQRATKDGESAAIAVPSSAVLWTGDKSVVYVKLEDAEVPSYQFREVEIASKSGTQTIVTSGLKRGEEIVTHGAFSIDAAAQLNNNMSMMNRGVTIKKDKIDKVPNYQDETPQAFKLQLNEVANGYIELKDAFVATDATQATSKASALKELYDKVDMSLVKDEAHLYWMDQLNSLTAHTQNIIESEEVEQQRKQFGFISDALINAISAFGTEGNALYVQHCPMAFSNKGADWIATEEQIQNPYFGDKMMKCGIVKKTFK